MAKKSGAESTAKTPPLKSTATADVSTQVFEKFLDAVTAVGCAPEMLGRLRKALLEDRDFTEDGLESAIFGGDVADD